jgi:recombinational DNA repair protein (RecF pathway)
MRYTPSVTDDAKCVECGAPLNTKSHRYRGAKRCRVHALALHPFTSETASRAALRRLELERAGKEALKREQERSAHGGSDGD